MDEEVDFLLLGPFNDLLEKAQAAVETAQDADNAEMLKAAQALVKEGERALKNTEHIARQKYGRYGANFVDALRDHEVISEHVDALNELIYVFDDYTEPDTFDASKFEELAKRSKLAVVRILPVLKRMKLEAPATPVSAPPTPSLAIVSPHTSPAVQRPETAHASNSSPQPAEALPVMGIQGGPDLGYNGGMQPTLPSQPTQSTQPAQPDAGPLSRPESRRSVASTIPPSPVPETPPPEPPINPWQLGVRPSIDTIPESFESENGAGPDEERPANGLDNAAAGNEDGEIMERRRCVSTRPDSPTLPPVSGARRLDDGVDAWQQQVAMEGSSNISPRTDFARPASTASESQSPKPRASTTWSFSSQQQQRQNSYGAPSPRQSQNSALSTAASTANNSVFSSSSPNEWPGQPRDSALEPPSPNGLLSAVSPVSPYGESALHLSATFASAGVPKPTPSPATAGGQEKPSPPPQPLPIGEQPGLEAVVAADVESGLIPVETPADHGTSHGDFVRPHPVDCTIGTGSSFYIMKGLCEGAREIQRGGSGVRQTKKLTYSGAGTMAAKCTSCLYELQWSEVQNDRSNLPTVNYRMHGIGFRLRFLSKSHLPAKQVDCPVYACLFCLQEGHTIEESDATVFFSQGQLFAHLSRHPRPLPHVPGVTVIDGPERSPELQNDYDLHFILPPQKSEMDGIQRELMQLPNGTTTETFRKYHGILRRPYDNIPPLQFPPGARIVGIEFPARYKGEWGVGWYDNVRGPFLAESVRLDPPRKDEVPEQRASNMRAIARWRWGHSSAYKNSGWLRIDKGDIITNVVYTHADSWCWAGTNPRGKWGYFPQSHMEPDSLMALTISDKVSISSRERVAAAATTGRSGGLLSRFRGHGNGNGNGGGNVKSNRPVSVASTSTSSSR